MGRRRHQIQRQRQTRGRQRRPVPHAVRASAHQHRGGGLCNGGPFDAPEVWHEPCEGRQLRVEVQSAGRGYRHAVTADEIRDRVSQLPSRLTQRLDVVQLSRMTRKRRLFPCYGLQWGTAVYLYPIEETLEERYTRCPRPAQRIETEMYGGRWERDGRDWRLIWTPDTIRDYYLNNVLIHEIGHVHDDRNARPRDRERFADWFAIEYGYRVSRGRRPRRD